MASGETVLVDVVRAADLGDADFVAEMATLYADSVGVELSAARAALSEGDAHGLALAAHAIKGASLGLFASTMVELADALEVLGRMRVLEPAPGLVARLESALPVTTALLRGAGGRP